MATLTKPELGVTIDLTGVTRFRVAIPRYSNQVPEEDQRFSVVAVFSSREETVMKEFDWDRANLFALQLTQHIINEGVDVTIHEDTGSIVPA